VDLKSQDTVFKEGGDLAGLEEGVGERDGEKVHEGHFAFEGVNLEDDGRPEGKDLFEERVVEISGVGEVGVEGCE